MEWIQNLFAKNPRQGSSIAEASGHQPNDPALPKCKTSVGDTALGTHLPGILPIRIEPPTRRVRTRRCGNCMQSYNSSTSTQEGFCSIDCKSNAIYLAHIHATIRDQQVTLSISPNLAEKKLTTSSKGMKDVKQNCRGRNWKRRLDAMLERTPECRPSQTRTAESATAVVTSS